MSFTLYNLLMFVFLLIDVYAYYRVLNHKLTYRFPQRTHIPAYIFIYAIMLLSAYSSELFPGLPLKLPLMLLQFICLFVMYVDAVYKRILWLVITFFALITCEILAIPPVVLLSDASLSNITQSNSTQIWGMALSRILLIATVELLVRTKKRIFDGFIKEYLLIIVVNVIYALVIAGLFYFDNIFLSVDLAITLSLFVMITISLLALYLLRKITKKSDEIMTTNLKLQQIEMEHKQNQDMAIVVEDLRALRHDMNNHMSVLQGLLTMGEYEDAKAYLSTIAEELTVANSFIFIDNKILSVLINNKLSKARQLGITIDTEILTTTTPFSDNDLCAVLGNILENAIEASTNHNNPYIYFSMKKANHQLLIQCDNTYTIPPIFKKGELVTTKADKAYHGIGTKTICSIIEKYRGTTKFTVDDMFHVNIVIPL